MKFEFNTVFHHLEWFAVVYSGGQKIILDIEIIIILILIILDYRIGLF